MLLSDIVSGIEKWPDSLCENCIGKIAGGDKDALGELYQNVKNAVYGFALSIVQNAQEAEDVLQDTFVSVYTSAGNYRKMGKPMAWILTITRNLCLMKIRDRRKTADLSEDEWSLFIADEAAATSEDKLVLTAALKAISPEESQIVMLHAISGFKHREIATFLELPLSTVLSKYNRAMKKLKSILEEDGIYAQ
jgi:RNA polymerase sigma-70 factor (ECF subfamily)